MDPQPPVPRNDPTNPANFAEWAAYSKAVYEWQQRQNANPSVPAPAPANSWLGSLNPFGGGRSRRSKRSKSKRSRKSRRARR